MHDNADYVKVKVTRMGDYVKKTNRVSEHRAQHARAAERSQEAAERNRHGVLRQGVPIRVVNPKRGHEKLQGLTGRVIRVRPSGTVLAVVDGVKDGMGTPWQYNFFTDEVEAL